MKQNKKSSQGSSGSSRKIKGVKKLERIELFRIFPRNFRPSITKWGANRPMTVSFQRFTNQYCCFQGDGSIEGTIGWGKTKEKAISNLLDRLVENHEALFG